MVHDMKNENSLMSIAQKYTPLVLKYAKPGSIKSILSAKCEMCPNHRRIFDQIDIFSDEYNLSPHNTSCSIKYPPKFIFEIFEKVARVQYIAEQLRSGDFSFFNKKKENIPKEEEEVEEKKEEEIQEIKIEEVEENKENKVENENYILADAIEENDEEEVSGEANKKFKIIFLGEKNVGKTSLINRYVNNKFNSFSQSSIDDTKHKKVKQDGATFDLSISDTTNEEKLGKFTKNYYRDAHGAIIVFDLTDENSANKVKFWLDELKENAPKDIVVCLLGNKEDLTAERKVKKKDVASADNHIYYEVSAKSGKNISLAFKDLINQINKKQKEEEKNPDKVLRGTEGRKTTNLYIDVKKKKKKKWCLF
jgi:small GTP-binding protein